MKILRKYPDANPKLRQNKIARYRCHAELVIMHKLCDAHSQYHFKKDDASLKNFVIFKQDLEALLIDHLRRNNTTSNEIAILQRIQTRMNDMKI